MVLIPLVAVTASRIYRDVNSTTYVLLLYPSALWQYEIGLGDAGTRLKIFKDQTADIALIQLTASLAPNHYNPVTLPEGTLPNDGTYHTFERSSFDVIAMGCVHGMRPVFVASHRLGVWICRPRISFACVCHGCTDADVPAWLCIHLCCSWGYNNYLKADKDIVYANSELALPVLAYELPMKLNHGKLPGDDPLSVGDCSAPARQGGDFPAWVPTSSVSIVDLTSLKAQLSVPSLRLPHKCSKHGIECCCVCVFCVCCGV